MLDVCKALVHARPTTGRRMALMAMTGGPSVGITDAFQRAGLEVPRLTDASYAELAEFFNVIGGSYQNPFDMAGTIRMTPQGEEDNFHRLLRIVDADPNIDAIALEARGVAPMSGDATQRMVETILEQQSRSAKPVVAIINPGSREGAAAETRQLFLENGIAAFHSFDRAAQALAKAIRYWRFRAGLD
jgi:acyl-CoA synthetase (NDP forming)